MIKYVIKRDGRKVEFNNQKIVAAVLKAMDVTDEGEDIVLAAKIAETISRRNDEEMSVEEIQDCVEMELMKSPRKEVAKRYIAYRNQRNLARKAKTTEIFQEIIDAQCRHSCRYDDEVRFGSHEDLCRRVLARRGRKGSGHRRLYSHSR